MKRKKRNNYLETIKITPIDLTHHQAELKKVLLTSPYWKNQSRDLFWFWKGGEESMKKKKLFSASLALAGIAIIVITSFALVPSSSKTAYAEQLAQQSYQKINNLSPQDLDALKQKVHMDPSELLQEAKNAKDLKTLTYDEFVQQSPMTKMKFNVKGPLPSGDPSLGTPETMDMHKFKFLQFTDSNGNKVTVGLDENNLPVLAFSINKDGTQLGVIKKVTGKDVGGGEGIGMDIPGKQVQGKPGEMATQNAMFINKDGQKYVNIDGKKYAIPSGNPEQTTVTANGGIYINGAKITPNNK